MTVVIIKAYHSANYIQNFIHILLSRLIPYAEEISGELWCGFRRSKSATDHISAFVKYLRDRKKGGNIKRQHVSYFKTSIQPDSVRKKVLHNILNEFGIPIKLVKPIKMCLNEIYSRVRVDKHLWDTFPIQNYLKQGDALSPLFLNFSFECVIRRVQVNQEGWRLNNTHLFLD